ncbi:MAG TPA: hypothetical protein VI968_03845 [archaeon]|nr:hypothetical protein [archaeon]
MAWDANKIGMAIENDYRWDHIGWNGSSYSLFTGSIDDLHDLRTPSVDEYLKADSSVIPMPDDLRERIGQLNELSAKTQSAARRGDLQEVRTCYQKFGKLKQDVPYDCEAVLSEWRNAGYVK